MCGLFFVFFNTSIYSKENAYLMCCHYGYHKVDFLRLYPISVHVIICWLWYMYRLRYSRYSKENYTGYTYHDMGFDFFIGYLQGFRYLWNLFCSFIVKTTTPSKSPEVHNQSLVQFLQGPRMQISLSENMYFFINKHSHFQHIEIY